MAASGRRVPELEWDLLMLMRPAQLHVIRTYVLD